MSEEKRILLRFVTKYYTEWGQNVVVSGDGVLFGNYDIKRYTVYSFAIFDDVDQNVTRPKAVSFVNFQSTLGILSSCWQRSGVGGRRSNSLGTRDNLSLCCGGRGSKCHQMDE